MSGYKHATVTISEDEYRRLHATDMKRKFKEFANLNPQGTQEVLVLQNMLRQMEERQRQLEEIIVDVGQNSSQIDQDCLQDIVMQNSFCYESLAASLERSTADLYGAISNISQHFANEMQQERDIYRQNLQSLIFQQDSYLQQEWSKERAAQHWLSQCQILAEFVQQQFDHERFFPGKFNAILRNFDFAIHNLSEGFSEASIQGSQQVYLELSDFHFELEQTIVHWQIAYEKTYFSIRQTIADIELNARVNALGLQGEQLEDEVDLDFWSNGKYSQLLTHSRLLLENYVQDQMCLTSQDIDRIYNEILPAIRESFEAIIYGARMAALNSQLRMNIAEKALQALETHGFKLETSGYTNLDMRSPFQAHLESFDGSQVDIQVIPTDNSSEELSNELFVSTKHPYLKTEHEARLYWDELSQSLLQFNLQVTRPEVISRQPGLIAQQNHPTTIHLLQSKTGN